MHYLKFHDHIMPECCVSARNQNYSCSSGTLSAARIKFLEFETDPGPYVQRFPSFASSACVHYTVIVAWLATTSVKMAEYPVVLVLLDLLILLTAFQQNVQILHHLCNQRLLIPDDQLTSAQNHCSVYGFYSYSNNYRPGIHVTAALLYKLTAFFALVKCFEMFACKRGLRSVSVIVRHSRPERAGVEAETLNINDVHVSVGDLGQLAPTDERC